jgi:hypothetical protein
MATRKSPRRRTGRAEFREHPVRYAGGTPTAYQHRDHRKARHDDRSGGLAASDKGVTAESEARIHVARGRPKRTNTTGAELRGLRWLD